jgi:hypothetical protein
MRYFLIARADGVLVIFDEYTYDEIDRIDLNLNKSTTREPNQILSMSGTNDN